MIQNSFLNFCKLNWNFMKMLPFLLFCRYSKSYFSKDLQRYNTAWESVTLFFNISCNRSLQIKESNNIIKAAFFSTRSQWKTTCHMFDQSLLHPLDWKFLTTIAVLLQETFKFEYFQGMYFDHFESVKLPKVFPFLNQVDKPENDTWRSLTTIIMPLVFRQQV